MPFIIIIRVYVRQIIDLTLRYSIVLNGWSYYLLTLYQNILENEDLCFIVMETQM